MKLACGSSPARSSAHASTSAPYSRSSRTTSVWPFSHAARIASSKIDLAATLLPWISLRNSSTSPRLDASNIFIFISNVVCWASGSHIVSCEGGPRSVPRGLELGARGGLGRALPGRSTGVLSHGRGRADGFSGPPAGAAPRNEGLLVFVRGRDTVCASDV